LDATGSGGAGGSTCEDTMSTGIDGSRWTHSQKDSG
jgi:hypothetical protein